MWGVAYGTVAAVLLTGRRTLPVIADDAADPELPKEYGEDGTARCDWRLCQKKTTLALDIVR